MSKKSRKFRATFEYSLPAHFAEQIWILGDGSSARHYKYGALAGERAYLKELLMRMAPKKLTVEEIT